MQTSTNTTKRKKTSTSATTKRQKTASPSSMEQREARKFWNDFTQQLSDNTWLPTNEDILVKTSCNQNTWFTATWKSINTTKNTQQTHHPAKNAQKHKRRRKRERTKHKKEKQKQKKKRKKKQQTEEEKKEKEERKQQDDGNHKKRKITRKQKKKEEGKQQQDDALPNEFKVRKIKLKLSQGQKTILNRWFGTFRWTYNRILKAIKNGDVVPKMAEIRPKFINNENFEKGDGLKWVLETPHDIREAAMLDLLAAYKTNWAKREKNKEHTFDIKPKTRKAATDSFPIHHKHYIEGGTIFPTFWRKDMSKPKGHDNNKPEISARLQGCERLPKTLNHAARLQRTRNGKFYLCIVSPIEVVGSASRPESFSSPNPNTPDRVIALDPGIRSFMTGYCPGMEGVMEWGSGDRTRLFRLCCVYDGLQSRWSKENHRKRYRMQRAGRRIQERIRNLVNEVHCKLVKWLVTNFDLVLLPKFETQSMCKRTQFMCEDGTVCRKSRKINGKVARAMYTWSHYKFQQRLLHKTREYPHCRVVICDEDFTSKTCGRCGFVHEKLGGNKTFKCPSCHVSLDRDVNGARNILLRYMTLNRAS